ncbi:MAG: flavin reductase family protein [Gemmatimonadales bacterium]
MTESPNSDVDSAVFRELCGRFATGVVIVTATDAAGAPMGMTANSFTSVSLMPPMISINVDRVAEFHAIIAEAGQFTINILSASQEALSRRFATSPGSDRFSGVGFRRTDRGRIHLTGAIAAIECEKAHQLDVGDHTIVVGRVVGGEVTDGPPLLYYRGGYRTLG